MKHSSIRELFDYWNERRGRRAAPERGDIEPGDIRGVLADTFILAFDAPASHPFRIAGTRVCALFGREPARARRLSICDGGEPATPSAICSPSWRMNDGSGCQRRAQPTPRVPRSNSSR
jgi:hypothetical protein